MGWPPTVMMLLQAMELLGYLSPEAVPLSVYGHSFGSYLALETAVQLKAEHSFRLDRLVVGGARATHVRINPLD